MLWVLKRPVSDVSFELPKYNGSVGQHFIFKTLRSGQVSLIYLAQAVRIIYAEDRAQMNRELNHLLYGKRKIGFLARQIGHGSTMRSRLS